MSERIRDEVVLKLDHVTKRFGGLTAVGDVTFEIKKGEIYGLIGPNGAGKTTIFNLITGVYALTEGEIFFCGDCIGRGLVTYDAKGKKPESKKPLQNKPYNIMS